MLVLVDVEVDVEVQGLYLIGAAVLEEEELVVVDGHLPCLQELV